VITDSQGRVLLVRKRGTDCFMQPGGKLNLGESPQEALARELREELGCGVVEAEFLGVFSAPAANEPFRIVEAALFRTRVAGAMQPNGEIEEIAWVAASGECPRPLAPLTRDQVLPLLAWGLREEQPGSSGPRRDGDR
jgi:8-oxo-dGTP pyrophosphatase MutT (NUDIX family)